MSPRDVVRALHDLQWAVGVIAVAVTTCLVLTLLICVSIVVRAVERLHVCTASSAKSFTAYDTGGGAIIESGQNGDG